MKRTRRTLSLLMALVMFLSVLPELHLPVLAEDETDITVDFEYAEKHGIVVPEQAMNVEAKKYYQSTEFESEDEIRKNYEKFYWQKANSWTVKDKDEYSLRDLITSTDPEDKYIALNNDDVHDYYKNTLWETMEITTDKVLDLNGHQFLMRYDANRCSPDNDYSQTDRIEFHNCLAFEIKDGATLTIIDSSSWRGEGPDGKGTGKLAFTGYMINPFEHQINSYTTRDLFKVSEGNLVIYGGTFQAGRQKTQYKSNFTWEGFKNVIGTAVELGVSVAEYATGLDVASENYINKLRSEKNPAANSISGDSSEKDDGTAGIETTKKRDGTDADPEDLKDSPTGAANHNKSVEEKQEGKNDGENKANEKKTGKDDKKTTVAEERKKVVDAAVNKKGIMGMVDKVFALGEGIAGLCGKDKSSFCVNYIHGTVVKVDNTGTFVAYGGTFHGYGSTPNTRNAVVEIAYNAGTHKAFDDTKVDGGLAYIYGGTFEGFGGANIFNFVHMDSGTQYGSQIVVDENGNRKQKMNENGEMEDVREEVALDESETGGVEVVYYDNQSQIGKPGVEPILVNTANVQVRGGVFRNHYELQNVAIREKDSDKKFTKFPGTNGTVNLGIESYGEQLIQDGRIQIVDRYGDGALVLLDKQTAEREAAIAAGETFTEGLYRYRLLCGDTELRCKSYLEVHPNEAMTNATKSMQLTGYGGDGDPVALLWADDKENKRAPLRKTENYFDFIYDDPDKSQNYYVMPKFHDPKSKDPKLPEFSQWHDYMASSEIWYYPTPISNMDGLPLEPVEYGEAWYEGYHEDKGWIRVSQQTCHGRWYDDLYLNSDRTWGKWMPDDWTELQKKLQEENDGYYFRHHDRIDTNMRYFSFKVYRVDPLSRENIVESGANDQDSPLIEVRYGTDTENLKCKLPLKEVEQQIKDIQVKKGLREKDRWKGFQSGEMYRIVMSVEERMGFGYMTLNGKGTFGDTLPVAKTESSILFRCLSTAELVDTDDGGAYKKHDFTPLQWVDNPELGARAKIQILNGKAGMTDFKHVNKVFDVYYQWWETDKDGNELRMIAGTDNVYMGDDVSERIRHWPKEWNNIEEDGHIYCNTFDPSNPGNSNLIYNGLPGYYDDDGKLRADYLGWDCYNLHMYTDPTVNADALTLGPGRLTPKNNNVYQTNTDTCYIPEDMGGKYVYVKAIVRCVEWQDYFDSLQTFKSHVMYIEPKESLGTSWANINKTEAVYGRVNNLSFTINGIASQLPEEKIHVQWQRREDLSVEWEDIPGATKWTYTIPKERVYAENGMLYMGYRAHIDFEGYYGRYAHIDTNECKMSYYLPLSCAKDLTIPSGETGTSIDPVNLADNIENGTGNYAFSKYEGPVWLEVNESTGMITGTRPDTEQSESELLVSVRDTELNTEIKVHIPVGSVIEPLKGTLKIQGTPKPSCSGESPNVLTAVVEGCNSEKLTIEWYGENNRHTVGSSYILSKSDANTTLHCIVVSRDGKAGRLEEWVEIGDAQGPPAPTVVPHYKKYANGNVECWIEVIDAVYPLQYDRSTSFSDYSVVQSGDIKNLTPGTYYVRSSPSFEQDPGEYVKVDLSESSMLTLQAPKVPFGVTGEAYETIVSATGGTPPYTFEFSNADYYNIHLGEMERIDDTSVRVYGTFPLKQYSSALNRDVPYCSGYSDIIKVTDKNGNTATGKLFYVGWDEAIDHKKLDMEITRHFKDFDQGSYTPGTGNDQIILLTNRSGETLDMSGLTFRVTKKTKDEDGNEIEVDASDLFDIIIDYEHQSLEPTKRYTLRMRYKSGCKPGYSSGFIYIGGLQGIECDGYGGSPNNQDGEASTYWGVTYKAARLKDCTVEPITPVIRSSYEMRPPVRIYDPDGVLLKEGEDYFVTYENNDSAGTASFTATGYGDGDNPAYYRGSVTGTFEIKKLTTNDKELDIYLPAGVTGEQKLPFGAVVHDSFGTLQNGHILSIDDPAGTVENKYARVNALAQQVIFTATGAAKDGDECTFQFDLASDNCETFKVNLCVHYTDRRIPTIVAKTIKKQYDGNPVTVDDLTCSATVDGIPIPGDWSFADPLDVRLTNATQRGTQRLMILFTPEDQEKYAPAYGYFYIAIRKAQVIGEPDYLKLWSYAGMYVFETRLNAENGTFSVPGNVRWADDVDQMEFVGYDTEYSWIFTPDDSANYSTISGKIVFYHSEGFNPYNATAVDAAVEPLEKVYDGKPVTVDDLTKTAKHKGEEVPGTWSFVDADENRLINPNDSGIDDRFMLKFTPKDTGRYLITYVGTWITIRQAETTGEPNWTRITEAGKHLSDVDLSDLGGTFSVPGTVSFDVPLDTEVKRDVAYPWTFQPADTGYAPLYGSLTPWRSKEPVLLSAEPYEKTYDGKKLTLDKLTKSATFEGKPVEGVWSFDDPNDERLTDAHEEEYIILRFTPADTGSLVASEVKLKLTIKKAAITGRPTFTPITEAGKTLADTNLTVTGGTFSVPGVVYYEMYEDTEVEKDKAYTWYFVPNSANYETISGTVVPWGEAPDTDKGELGSALEAAEKVDKSKYTAESVAVLEAAVAAAKTVQADTGATQAAVDAAAKAVRDSIAALVPASDDPGNPFVDVKSGAFYYDPVLWAVGHDPQITKGTDSTHFSPDDTCTRGQVVTFLWRAKGCPEPTLSLNPFSDVKEGAFYYKAVLWAVQNGITNGVDKTHFGPNMGCTRGQVVTFLWRAEGQPAPGSDANPFKDVKGGFYYSAVLWAVEKNITKGTSSDKFSPDQTCTRGQIVTFLYRDMS